MTPSADFLALPKAELHLHIEGSLEPQMLWDLARRNDVDIPFASVEAIREAYRFTRLQDFLDIYYQGMGVLLTARDYEDLAFAYFQRAAADGVVRAEIFFDPQGHTSRGVALATVMTGLNAAIARARAELGLSVGLILCFLRHLDEDDALACFDAAMGDWRGAFLGVGLDSSELGHPPGKFARVFARARSAGLKLVAHAGEEGPPDYIWQALDVLGVDRIDHGNRALEDRELVRRLARDAMALTVCPLSNLKLCVVGDMAAHPARRMLDLGLKPCINSDDPAYFGGYLLDNFRVLDEALDLTEAERVALARNGITAAFWDDAEKARVLAQYPPA